MRNWRTIQRKNFHDWKTLVSYLELDESLGFASHFPLNLPLRLAEKIEKRCPDDPILLQFLPQHAEKMVSDAFQIDPVQDRSFQKTSRLLQKYAGRVLLIVTGGCVMNCRFCFRQNYPYEQTIENYLEELEIIRKDPTIHEVILSGGDPLSLSDAKLTSLIENLSNIPHLKLLRFHTRFPLGIPERITDQFLSTLKHSRLQTVFILHTNHPRELDEDVFLTLKKIQQLGIPVLTQTVLLKNVNDTFETLAELFMKLISHGVIPYYLHQLDRVKGTAHFEVPVSEGQKLIRELRAKLPGYAIPTYVQEIPNQPNKTPVTCEASS